MPTAAAGPEIERLIALLARLPGLGPRSARRAALFLIKKREQIMAPLAAAMQTALEKIEICRVCGNIDTQNPCTVCTDGGIAPHIGTDRARILGVDIAAHPADLDFFQRGMHRRGKRRHDLLALLDEKQRRAPRRAGAEPRQAGEQGDQTLDLGSGSGGRHERRRRPAIGYCTAVDAGGARSAVIN